MAKGLRSSSKKANRTKLRARVFQPVEEARLERLHQKLLETAQQPKPETAKEKEMDVDSAEGESFPFPSRATNNLNLTCIPTDATATTGTKEDDFPKGSFLLSTPIPHSLLATSTSTSTPSCPPSDDTTPDPDSDPDSDSHFYHLLSLSTSIHSFTPTGHLALYFDPLPL